MFLPRKSMHYFAASFRDRNSTFIHGTGHQNRGRGSDGHRNTQAPGPAARPGRIGLYRRMCRHGGAPGEPRRHPATAFQFYPQTAARAAGGHDRGPARAGGHDRGGRHAQPRRRSRLGQLREGHVRVAGRRRGRLRGRPDQERGRARAGVVPHSGHGHSRSDHRRPVRRRAEGSAGAARCHDRGARRREEHAAQR